MSQPRDGRITATPQVLPAAQDLAPHRGQMIMILGIISLFMAGLVLGPIAWIMGRNDLREMDEGRMDGSGRDNTNTGRVCGMIATILHGSSLAVALFCCLGYFVVMGAMFTTAVSTTAATSAKMAQQTAKAQEEAQQRHQQIEEEQRKAEKEAEEARRKQEEALKDKGPPPILPNPNPPDLVFPKPPAPEVAQPIADAIAQPPAPPDVPGKTTVDLIPLIDPLQDTVHGKWVVVDKALHCNHQSFVPRIQIPYQPPEEYNFTLVFSQPRLRNGISAIMPNPKGNVFFWEVGGRMGRYQLSTRPPKRNWLPNMQKLQPNTAYTTTVEVRRDSIRCLLDGKEIIRHGTDFTDLVTDNWRKMNDTRVLSVGCDDPTVFHYVRVVEISGPGKKTREK